MNNLRKFLCKYGTSKSLIMRRRRQKRSISMSNDFLRIKKGVEQTNFPMDMPSVLTPTLGKIRYWNKVL